LVGPTIFGKMVLAKCLKFFRCLSDTFRHGVAKHKIALEVVLVTVQYHMDNGSNLFEA
jgi:hypothetical protein